MAESGGYRIPRPLEREEKKKVMVVVDFFFFLFKFFFDNSEKDVAVKKFVIVAVEIYAGNRGKRVDVGGWARHV